MSARLIIAGGGIGGLAAALALQRVGVEATVYERAPEFREIGAGMSLWPNATRVLAAWGLLESVLALGEPVIQFNLRRPSGKLISAVPMGGYGTPSLCIHRSDLHRVLYQSVRPAGLVTDQRLRVFRAGAAGVTAEFAGGSQVQADGLIGADGIHSVIRAQLHGAAEPVYRGYRIWRGLAPAVPGQVRGHTSETWGAGCRFGIMPLGRGRVCWYATRNGPPAGPSEAASPKAELLDRFGDWHDPIPALLATTAPADIIATDAHDRPALARWGLGPVTLLGDAAHPLTPNVGQGACLAIEDAACLAKAMAREPDVAAAFRAYERRRQLRTAQVVRQARRIGAIGQWQNPWLVPIRDWVVPLVLRSASALQLNSLYAYEV